MSVTNEHFDRLMRLLSVHGMVGVAQSAKISTPDLFDPKRAAENARVVANKLRAIADELLDDGSGSHRAQPLFLADGRQAKVWYCPECRITGQSREAVDYCCLPAACDDCGAPAAQYSTVCDLCWYKRAAERARKRWEAAEVVDSADAYAVEDEWGDPVGSSDGWFYDLGELQEWLDEWRWEHPGEPDPTLYVYAGEPTTIEFDASRLLEHALEEAHEDTHGEISEESEAELQAALDAWSKAHSPTWYEPSNKKVIWAPEAPGEQDDGDGAGERIEEEEEADAADGQPLGVDLRATEGSV